MGQTFGFFVEMGIRHITDFEAYDHMLFLLAICAPYAIAQWRKVLLLVTAFTVGHTITLIINGLGILSIPGDLIEFLIPITIALAALVHLLTAFAKKQWNASMNLEYLLVALFGLIHGAGFSNFFKALFSGQNNKFQALLGFNIGVEIGQILIVITILLLQFVAVRFLKLQKKYWQITVSLIALIISLRWIIQNITG